MTIGISKEELLDIDPWAYDNQQDLLNAIIGMCKEFDNLTEFDNDKEQPEPSFHGDCI